MKLEFNMQRIARNPVASFDIFSQKVTKSIKKKVMLQHFLAN